MKRLILPIVVATAMAASQSSAHHSFAMFDNTKLVVLKGTMLSFAYLNPHSWISVLGSPDGKGKPERWDVEATAPMMLKRLGINSDTLIPGDKIVVGIRPLRDGRNGGSFVFIIKSDGKSYGANPGEAGYTEK